MFHVNASLWTRSSKFQVDRCRKSDSKDSFLVLNIYYLTSETLHANIASISGLIFKMSDIYIQNKWINIHNK